MVLINQNYLKPTGLPPLNIKRLNLTRGVAERSEAKSFFRPEQSELASNPDPKVQLCLFMQLGDAFSRLLITAARGFELPLQWLNDSPIWLFQILVWPIVFLQGF